MTKHSEPICESCGYELGGLAAVTQICPECGVSLDWPRILAARPEHRWQFELGRGLAPARFAKTTIRLVLPPLFWSGLGRDIPVRVGRLVLWLGLILVLAYLVSMTASFAWRFGLVHMGAGQPIVLPGLQNRMEFFLPGLYDAGEVARDGTVKPLWFPNRYYPALVAGSLAAGLVLTLISGLSRNAHASPRLVARVTVFGLAPLAIYWLVFAESMTLAALNCFGMAGISAMRATWSVIRVEYWIVVAWWLAYWWFASRRGLGLKWWAGGAAVVGAVLASAAIVLSDWRFWAHR